MPKSSMSSAGDKAPSTNKGKTTTWSASATMANTMAARKRGPGEIVTVSLVTAVLLSLLSAYFRPILRECQSAYQPECCDQRPHERHWVEVHWWRHAGHTPPVSTVFQWDCQWRFYFGYCASTLAQRSRFVLGLYSGRAVGGNQELVTW